MTIDSTWLCAFKEELPHAFTPKRPFTPAAAFVDGQIRLMQGMRDEAQTWDDYIFRQYARHLTRLYEVCDVVVLAFDNYEHVPLAKCMTQLKRRRNIPTIPFGAHSELPCMVPEGERWTQCISNRTFKARVIDLIILRLPALLLHMKPSRRFVVDYQEPVEYRFNPGTNQIERKVLEGMPALGEADLKFARHANAYGSLMVDSIDGDSIPIALMFHEAELRNGMPPPNVAVYRLELKTEDCKESQKRTATEAARRAGRKYEYVDIHALYAGLKDVIAQCTGRVRVTTHAPYEVTMLVSLIALTGTDFSRKLPLLRGRTLYALLADIWPTVALAFDPSTLSLREGPTSDLLALLYRTRYNRHTRSSHLADVLQELRSGTLGPRTKNQLPSLGQALCTVRNVNWVLAYWTCKPYPNPLQPIYGFRATASGNPEYDDQP